MINRRYFYMILKLILSLGIILIAVFLGMAYAEYNESKKGNVELREVFLLSSIEKVNEYKLEKIIEENERVIKEENLYKNIEEIIGMYSQNEDISISFNDFSTGKYIGSNDQRLYIAASTTKIPLAMIICEEIINGNLSLDSTIRYSLNDYEEGAGVMYLNAQVGQAYTIETLLYNMIVYSDNVAANMLYRYFGFYESRAAMGRMINSEMQINDNTITSEEMNKFLTILYENRDSEYYSYLVDILQETIFHDRLDKYIPEEIVAHKIGDYLGNTHDCGIIFGERDYALSIFTDNIINAHEIIAEISRDIYSCYIDSGLF